MTIAFWFRADDFGTHDARFISKAIGENDNQHYWMVSTIQGDQLRFRLRTGGTTTTLIAPGETVTANTWTHVAAVYDGASMKLFQDGVVIASTAKSGDVDTNPNVHAAIGNQPAGVSGGDRPFDGLIDEVRLYSRALSPEEISVVRDATRPAMIVGYVGWTASEGLFGADALPHADPDSDRLNNLTEYATGTSSASPVTGSMVSGAADGTHLALNFRIRKAATDLTYRLQVSDDLINWIDAAIYRPNGMDVDRDISGVTLQARQNDSGDFIEITERDATPASIGQRFIRLTIIR